MSGDPRGKMWIDPGRPYDYITEAAQNTQPMIMLTVSDVERLAKAGVKVDMEQIKHQICPDPVHMRQVFDCSHLTQPIVDRWQTALRAQNPVDYFQRDVAVLPFQLSAAVHNDKVYVFAAVSGQEPVILEDDATIFPSDALMAKLHLMLKFNGEKS